MPRLPSCAELESPPFFPPDGLSAEHEIVGSVGACIRAAAVDGEFGFEGKRPITKTQTTFIERDISSGSPLSAGMGHLISLRLKPLPASSASYSSPPNSPPSRPLPPIPAKLQTDSEQRMSSIAEGPRTQEDWRKVLDEVRSLYVRRRYKQCSNRCLQLLDVAPDTLPPIYCVYLSFYAAMCLELTGRPLATDSSHRLVLFQLARVHYQKAEHFTWEAESEYAKSNRDRMSRIPLKTHQRLTSSSSETSTTSFRSSVGSNADSVYSRNSSSSAASSIRSSAPKSPNESSGPLVPQPLRVKKSVTFFPDFPKPPSSSSSSPRLKEPTSSFSKSSKPSTSISHLTRPRSRSTPKPLNTGAANITSSTPPAIATPPNFSLHETRFQTHLSSLSTQLKSHITTIEALISHTLSAHHPDQELPLPEVRYEPQLHQSHHLKHHQQDHQQIQPLHKAISTPNLHKPRSSSLLPPIFDVQNQNQSNHSYTHSTVTYNDSSSNHLDRQQQQRQQQQERHQQARLYERAARIEALKKRGREWERGVGRFNPSRSERVCGEALRELRGR